MGLQICNYNEMLVLVKHGLVKNGKEQDLDFAHIYPREYLNPERGNFADKAVAVNQFNALWTSRRKKNDYLNKSFNQQNATWLIRMTDRIWDAFEKVERKE